MDQDARQWKLDYSKSLTLVIGWHLGGVKMRAQDCEECFISVNPLFFSQAALDGNSASLCERHDLAVEQRRASRIVPITATGDQFRPTVTATRGATQIPASS